MSEQASRARARIGRVGFVSLGCPKALVDTERIVTELRAEGYIIAADYKQADLVIVNGENVAGVGITPGQADDIFDAGADVITLGNHVWNKRQISEVARDISPDAQKIIDCIMPASITVGSESNVMFGILTELEKWGARTYEGKKIAIGIIINN